MVVISVSGSAVHLLPVIIFSEAVSTFMEFSVMGLNCCVLSPSAEETILFENVSPTFILIYLDAVLSFQLHSEDYHQSRISHIDLEFT